MALPILEILTIGTKILDKIIPDPAEKAKAQLELLKLQQNGELALLTAESDIAKGQIATNIEEAKSESGFKSGWRPFIGWTCGLGFFAKFIGGPLLFIIAQFTGHMIQLPEIGMVEILPLLFGMLGLGAYRSYEKVATNK